MALIKCKECGKEISDTVKQCPHCGYYNKKEIKKLDIKGKIKALIIIVILGLLCFFLFKYGIRFLETSKTYSEISKNTSLSSNKYKSTSLIWEIVGIAFFVVGIIGIIFDVNLIKKRYKELLDSIQEEIPVLILLVVFIIISLIVEEKLYFRYCLYKVEQTNRNIENIGNYYDSVIDSIKSGDFCVEKGCINERATGSIYCYTHKPTYSYSSSTSFTNKYGTSTTKCSHNGCTNYIASSGDTNCCTIHSNKCENCKKYIDEDAFYCMDCITKSLNR